jgi:membrane-associated phospholipid phosphatase
MIVAHLVDVRTASFPSGHAMDSAFVYGSLAIVMAAEAGGDRRGTVAIVVAMVLIFAIGLHGSSLAYTGQRMWPLAGQSVWVGPPS